MKRLRCAVYTRKSSEEGLDQSFNSLHAQREACDAYILSQKGEGWTSLKTAYDDGGLSGGSMDRPGLQQLLADIAAGKVDVVVVYKVDRLTRSLTDFARIVEVFDRHGVSFVSVTQAFNTTTSMGRLTLNVLLSFAQFEREVTGERIRDKIAASKAKGMWMGGNLPLGYDTRGRTLVVNEAEAATVRIIFRRYIELGSVHRLKEALDQEGIVSKVRTSAAGRRRGGLPFSRGALFHLLQNRIYLGEIVHRGKPHPGLHEAILEPDQFEAAQALLAANRSERSAGVRTRAPLTGRIFDDRGEPMSPAHSRGRAGRTYRYYVAARLQQGSRAAAVDPDALLRLPANAIEDFALDRLRRVSGQATVGWDRLGPMLQRVEVHPHAIALIVSPPVGVRLEDRIVKGERLAPTGDLVRLISPVRLKVRGGRSWMLAPDDAPAVARVRPDEVLIAGLRRAHAELDGHSMHPRDSDLAAACGIADPYIRKLVRLAFLAPDIQSAIVEGRQPPGLTLKRIMDADVPLTWPDQRRLLGFAAAA